MIVEIELTPRAVEEIGQRLRAYRRVPGPGSTATPELLALALREEERLCDAATRDIVRLLLRHRPAALDCEVIRALDDLRGKVGR